MFTHLMIWYFNFISVESPDQMLVGVGDLKDAVHFSALNIFRPVVLTDSVLYENSFYCLKLSIVWLYPWRTSEAKSLPQIILISHSHVFVSFGFCVEQGSIGNVTGELLSSEFIWHMVNRIKIAIENMANLPSFFVCFAHQCPPQQNIQQQTEKICFVNPQAIFQAGSGEGANERVLSSLRVL